eukprot:6193598-Pleurochrysis_carterae.AAC.2
MFAGAERLSRALLRLSPRRRRTLGAGQSRRGARARTHAHTHARTPTLTHARARTYARPRAHARTNSRTHDSPRPDLNEYAGGTCTQTWSMTR